jgi:galactose-1-phosphate uridylyltransferase
VQNENRSLIVYEDEEVLLFVPKAQTSQWELQLMTLQPIGNILEADTKVRKALNTAMHKAMRTLTGLGARMISTIEYSKRFSAADPSQRLLYSFLPKLPDSPGAFSEAQLRWINGHYPEDFAQACRLELQRQSR